MLPRKRKEAARPDLNRLAGAHSRPHACTHGPPGAIPAGRVFVREALHSHALHQFPAPCGHEPLTAKIMSLPQSVKDIADLLGTAAALALVKAYGGVYVKCPVAGGRDGKTRRDLFAILGEEKANIFIRHYAGERVAVARCHSSLRDARDTEIITKYDSGVSAAKLALEYGMTERNVRNILKRIPEGMEGAA